MKRTAVIVFLAGTALALLVYWLAGHTEWTEAKIPMPLRGEARTDPFYAAERLTEALGAHATRARVLTLPPVNAVIVLSAWNWSLSTARRDALERWVESGGRLVVDRTVIDSNRDFERWSRIVRKVGNSSDPEDNFKDPCHRFEEERDGVPVTQSEATGYWICDIYRHVSLTSTQKVQWALGDDSGVQAMRVAIGRGSVTLINADPFRYSNLLDGDHGPLLVAAAQLRRNDEVHFLSEEDHPSLLALVWQHGAPVVTLTAALVALVLWRRAIRFGPRAAPHVLVRRSLAEQIRGTGQFALRHGGGRRSLHAACVRALDEAARRRINRYARLHADARAAAVASLIDVDAPTLASAIDAPEPHSPHDLRRTIAVLETARRGTIIQRKRLSHGIR